MRCQACLAALVISEFPPASGVCPSSSRATSRSARSTCAGGGRRGRTRRRVAPRAEGHPRPRAAAATGPATERGIPGGAEPLRRNAGSCQRHDRVIGVKNVGETSGIALSLGQRAEIVDRAHAPAVREELAQRFAWLAACDQGARLCAISVAMMSPARTS
jgi:hypothetical protein